MLPGKVLFQAIKYQTQYHNNQKIGSLFKLNLVLNEIYYDQLKQFHTKYLCVTISDVLTLELFDNQTQALIGTANIYEVYKLIQEYKTIEIKINNPQIMGELILLLNFQPVSILHKKKTISPTKRKIQTHIKSPSPNSMKHEIYSDKQNLAYIKEESQQNEQNSHERRYQSNDSKLNNSNSHQKIFRTQSQSIQTLAQQRQKILGELFGKFKRQR